MAAYDQTVGYASLESTDLEKLRETIRIAGEILASRTQPAEKDLILVAGCGFGEEAVLLNELFGSTVHGVDISLREDRIELNPKVTIARGSLDYIDAAEGQYDFIYSYHVLEHVPDHLRALSELLRVLKKGGYLYIGFPNKHRLVGYLGTHNEVSARQKIAWNFRDYRQRLLGKFENHLGAHAGFTQKEFLADATALFRHVEPVRNEYFNLKYKRFQSILKILIAFRLVEILYPSNYYLCQK